MSAAAMEIVPTELNEAGQNLPDRRETSKLESYKFLVALVSLLLVIGGGFWSIASRFGEWSREQAETRAQLVAISADVRSTRDLILTTQTKQTADIAALTERMSKVENAMSTQQQAYNFNFTTRLAAIEAKTGIKSSKE
jgi:hypothetical protein